MKNELTHTYLSKIKCFVPSSNIELIRYAVEKKLILIALNAEKILNSTPESRQVINENIGFPDGIGVVWALHDKGFNNALKIPGCELWLDIIKECESNKTFYLIGGEQEVIISTVSKLKVEFPNINLINFRNGFINNENEKIELLNDIVRCKPDVVFVAMGSPRQELLMEELYKLHPAVYQGLGGSFDVYVGKINRAPDWWLNNNLEWAYRLLKQPSRIKRQIKLLYFYAYLKLGKF